MRHVSNYDQNPKIDRIGDWYPTAVNYAAKFFGCCRINLFW